jgi:hypothetical protein
MSDGRSDEPSEERNERQGRHADQSPTNGGESPTVLPSEDQPGRQARWAPKRVSLRWALAHVSRGKLQETSCCRDCSRRKRVDKQPLERRKNAPLKAVSWGVALVPIRRTNRLRGRLKAFPQRDAGGEHPSTLVSDSRATGPLRSRSKCTPCAHRTGLLVEPVLNGERQRRPLVGRSPPGLVCAPCEIKITHTLRK